MNTKSRELLWCSNCKEKSVVVRFNKSKTKRWHICINRSCGFVLDTTYPRQKIAGVYRRHDVKL